MPTNKMHADEAPIDAILVRRLLATQFPLWAELNIQQVHSAGTDHALYKLGDDMVVRMPRIQRVTSQMDKEHQWLPQLAPFLPLAIPTPLAKGKAGEGYPWQWSIYRWLEGQNATIENLTDIHLAARELGRFIVALQHIDTTGGPLAGEHNFYRGVPLAMRNEPTLAALSSLHGIINVDAATKAWEAALRAPLWQGSPVWVHGDLQAGNLLAVDGQLNAVIDFGGLGIGDPACDLIVAWNLLPTDARAVFRTATQVDDATWARGRGWALSIALIQLPYYKDTNPTLAANARYVINEVLGEY